MKKIATILLFYSLFHQSCLANVAKHIAQLKQHFWQEVFFDPGNEQWQTRWFLGGSKALIVNDDEKMTLDTSNDAFAVLWTHDTFKGNISHSAPIINNKKS